MYNMTDRRAQAFRQGLTRGQSRVHGGRLAYSLGLL
jgi:hypothetical protein